jgi:hypothetical protein
MSAYADIAQHNQIVFKRHFNTSIKSHSWRTRSLNGNSSAGPQPYAAHTPPPPGQGSGTVLRLRFGRSRPSRTDPHGPIKNNLASGALGQPRGTQGTFGLHFFSTPIPLRERATHHFRCLLLSITCYCIRPVEPQSHYAFDFQLYSIHRRLHRAVSFSSSDG